MSARSVLPDLTPLRVSPAYRRLWTGQTISAFGQQMALVAISFEAYQLTGESFAVGLIGLFGLLPLVLGGLYGGTLVDAFDRRTVALVSALGLWACSLALVTHVLAGWERVEVLYAIVAVQSAMFAVNNPARAAMLPRLLPMRVLPAANALGMASFTLSFTVGSLLGGSLIAAGGVRTVYIVDAVLLTAAIYSILRLPSLPPGERAPVPGLRSVIDGLGFLRQAPNLRTSFVLDMCAMVLAQPRAAFPALAVTVYLAGGSGADGAWVLGLLQAAPAIGSFLAFCVSGWISRVYRHGVAIVVAVLAYGVAVALAGVTAIGLPGALWLGVTLLALSGSADMVSSAYRSTMLQTAAPDEMRGRMQGVFTVVVAGGPRLGDFLMGSLASVFGEGQAMVIGGVLCVAGVVFAVLGARRFLLYDARHPLP